LTSGPALFLDEVRDEQPVPRIAPISLHHADIDWVVAKGVPKFLERLAVLDTDVVS
jgi:hypothetical protein